MSGTLDLATATISGVLPVANSPGDSVADSKAVSAGSRASAADSKAVSVSSNMSVADSKAVSAAQDARTHAFLMMGG